MNTTNTSYIENLERLHKLLNEPVPKFKEIEKLIEKIHPALISNEIQKDVGFAYLMNYYFKVIDEKIVRSIINHPMFSDKALVELFYCHIGSIQKDILSKQKPPELLSYYWKYLSKAQYAILLKDTIQKSWFLEPAKNLLQNVDLVHIKLLTQSGKIQPSSILNLFKELGDKIKKLFSEDIHFYDYVFELASKESDSAFLEFLENYTFVFVQLRIASTFVQEMQQSLQKSKKEKPSIQELVSLFSQVPPDSLEVTLEIFIEKGWVNSQEMELILSSISKKNFNSSNHPYV